jgi:hypothetical protein
VSTWTKAPPVERQHIGCLNCGTRPVVLRAEAGLNLHPGFGILSLTRDGKTIWQSFNPDKSRTLLGFERQAARDPEHDWRVTSNGPLRDATYQRQGKGEWVLVETGRGFA